MNMRFACRKFVSAVYSFSKCYNFLVFILEIAVLCVIDMMATRFRIVSWLFFSGILHLASSSSMLLKSKIV
jgi:hypothetical protein